MVRRQRLLVVDVEARAGDAALLQRGDQRRLVDQRPAAGVHEERARLHPRELGRADDAARAVRQDEVQGHHVGLRAAASSLSTRVRADRRGALVGQVRAPGDHLHAEGRRRPAPPARRACRGRARRASCPPARRRAPSASAPRAAPAPAPGCGAASERISPQVRSTVGLPKLGVPQTVMPRSAQAATSTERLRAAVVISRRRFGRRSISGAREGRALAHDDQRVEGREALRPARPRSAMVSRNTSIRSAAGSRSQGPSAQRHALVVVEDGEAGQLPAWRSLPSAAARRRAGGHQQPLPRPSRKRARGRGVGAVLRARAST